MTVHEPEIQQLAKSSLGGQRFELFIRRWEMNNEPLPPESKPEVYVIIYAFRSRHLSDSLFQ
jgi:protein phosphatase-4 regulatory subunit 3